MPEMLCLHRSYKGRHCTLPLHSDPAPDDCQRVTRGVCQQLCLNKDCKAAPPNCAADLETNTTKPQEARLQKTDPRDFWHKTAVLGGI